MLLLGMDGICEMLLYGLMREGFELRFESFMSEDGDGFTIVAHDDEFDESYTMFFFMDDEESENFFCLKRYNTVADLIDAVSEYLDFELTNSAASKGNWQIGRSSWF